MILFTLSMVGALAGAAALGWLLRPDHYGDLARLAEIRAARREVRR